MLESVKLSEIVTFVRGLTYSKKDEVDANGLAVLRATNVSLEHQKITLDEIRYIKTPVKLNEDKLVKVGDILMCTASGSKSHLGKCALVKEDLGMAFGGFMAALRCKSSCLPEYLFYILTSNLFLKRLSSLSDGASINNLKFSQIEDFEFPLPPLAEQERIVAKLDAAFAEIDTGIEAANAKVMEVDCIFKKELENIFSNGEFKSVNLEELAKVTSSKRVLKSHYVESGIPFYRTKEVKELANGKPIRTELFISQEQFNEFKNKSGAPKPGDVLITAIGTIGEVYVVQQGDEFYFKDGNILWLRNISGLNSYYLRYSLINFVDELNRLAHGAAYSALPIQRLKSHKIPVKSLSEQSSLVLKLDTLGKLIQDIGELNNNKISALKALKSAMLFQELQSSEAA